MERIRHFWLSQAGAEYASAAVSSEFALWLCQNGASPDLICQCLDIAKDEIAHAMLSYDVAREAGHSGGLAGGTNLVGGSPRPFAESRKNLLDVILRFFCLGETIAVPLFAAMRKRCRHETALAAYTRIIADEPRHSEFGWVALAWMQANWPEVHAWIGECFANSLRQLAGEYYCLDEYVPPLTETERAWGMLPRLDYAVIFEKTVLNQCARRLEVYGIDVATIWSGIRQDLPGQAQPQAVEAAATTATSA
ncbi:MAG: ferritin-like domain-containing protein [Comamonadaceae bacterium]|nr:MAG: ferritin-like domain-containing protein [Comamonadaceae bacterium]